MTTDTLFPLDTLLPIDAGDLEHLHGRIETSDDVDIAYRVMDAPIGRLLLAATPAGLARVAFDVEGLDAVLERLAERLSPRIVHGTARLDAAMRQLDEYFAGGRHEFDLPLDHALSSGFRDRVQRALPQIPYGQTRSYAQVAALVGSPRAVRAVGTACATNPLPIVVPCHRVLRSDGSVGQYLGGAELKAALIEAEARG